MNHLSEKRRSDGCAVEHYAKMNENEFKYDELGWGELEIDGEVI